MGVFQETSEGRLSRKIIEDKVAIMIGRDLRNEEKTMLQRNMQIYLIVNVDQKVANQAIQLNRLEEKLKEARAKQQ